MALDEYLDSIKDLTGFSVGDGETLTRLEDSQGRPGQALAYAFDTMRVAWAALPEDIRSEALALLQDAIAEAYAQLGGMVESVPVIGWIVELVVLVFEKAIEIKRAVAQNNKAWSLQQKNQTQIYTFQKLESPTQWVYGMTYGWLYQRFRDKVGKDRWREVPALEPLLPDQNYLFGYDRPIAPRGNCSPGRSLRAKLDGSFEARKGQGSKCDYQVQVSALFYPFFAPNYGTEPLPFYGIDVWPEKAGFKDAGEDPNRILIERQGRLLSDPIVNLSADGNRLRRRLAAMLKSFELNGTAKVDQVERETSHYMPDPPAKYYLDENGLMRTYTEVAKLGKASMFDEIMPFVSPFTPAKYNCVVGMTRAFFTARAAFLTNHVAMKQYAEDGRVDEFPELAVRLAVKEVAAGDPGPKRQPSGRFQGLEGMPVTPAKPKRAPKPSKQSALAPRVALGATVAIAVMLLAGRGR